MTSYLLVQKNLFFAKFTTKFEIFPIFRALKACGHHKIGIVFFETQTVKKTTKVTIFGAT